ncbi:MAG: lipocalin-like domain-containing protein [Gammaproteobacteria bacterium]
MRAWLVGLLAVLVLVFAVALVMKGSDEAASPETALAVSSLLGEGDDAGLSRADPDYRPVFPVDHGPHPDFRSEWWYFTGNLEDGNGRAFGFQFTIFRFAMDGETVDRPSRWATRQAWMAHLAVTDAAGQRFLKAERLARGGDLGLAGATHGPFRAWVGDWEMVSEGEAFLPLSLSADAEDFGLRLRLLPGRGPVLQGEQGYSRKGPGEGNASHYYSYTRLPAAGELQLAGEVVSVQGNAWLDREWGTSALGPDVSGWDWFSLQFDDDTELMYYQLRRDDGSADPLSSGSMTGPVLTPLRSSEVRLEPTRFWRSDATGIEYPVAWRMEIPSRNLVLDVDAVLDQQEMDVSVNYWEGAVVVSGTRDGRPLRGRGYLEMTGYDRNGLSP